MTGPTLSVIARALRVLCLAFLVAPPAGAGAAPPLRLTVAFTGDVSGYLEPCG